MITDNWWNGGSPISAISAYIIQQLLHTRPWHYDANNFFSTGHHFYHFSGVDHLSCFNITCLLCVNSPVFFACLWFSYVVNMIRCYQGLASSHVMIAFMDWWVNIRFHSHSMLFTRLPNKIENFVILLYFPCPSQDLLNLIKYKLRHCALQVKPILGQSTFSNIGIDSERNIQMAIYLSLSIDSNICIHWIWYCFNSHISKCKTNLFSFDLLENTMANSTSNG